MSLFPFLNRNNRQPTMNKRLVKRQDDFRGGLDTLHSPFNAQQRSVVDIQNFDLDIVGSLKKRKGSERRYTSPFNLTGGVTGLFNFVRSIDATSRIVIASGGRLFSDILQIVHRWDSQTEWEQGTRSNIDTTTQSGSIRISAPATNPTPAFTRDSIAHTLEGVQVGNSVPRYQFGRFPNPLWRDLFDTDQLSTHYTSGGDTPATWSVSGGVLTGTGGSQATLACCVGKSAWLS